MKQAHWKFFNPVKVFFEAGSVSRLAEYLDYKRVVLVTSPGFTRRGVVERIEQSLGSRLILVLDDVKPNPDLRDVDRQLQILRPLQPDCIVGLGGGSSIDTAKALARFLVQDPSVTVMEHFRRGQELGQEPAMPVAAIPTTAGTGAEVTPFGTVWDFEENRKYSVAGQDLFPSVAILDPELTMGLPMDVTISSGLDAVSHALESIWNKSASPVTLGLATKSLQLSIEALKALKAQPDDSRARGSMMQASLLAGLCISQTRTALAHSISYPLTTHFNLPHGIACSFTLPALLRFNAEADDGRLMDVARALGHEERLGLAAELDEVLTSLDVRKVFFDHIAEPTQVLSLVDEMFTPGRADNNMRAASLGDVECIVRNAMEPFLRHG